MILIDFTGFWFFDPGSTMLGLVQPANSKISWICESCFVIQAPGPCDITGGCGYRCNSTFLTTPNHMLGVVRGDTDLKLSTREGRRALLFSLVLSYSLRTIYSSDRTPKIQPRKRTADL